MRVNSAIAASSYEPAPEKTVSAGPLLGGATRPMSRFRLTLPLLVLTLAACAAGPVPSTHYISPALEFVEFPVTAALLPTLSYVPEYLSGPRIDEVLYTVVGKHRLLSLSNPARVDEALDQVGIDWMGTVNEEQLLKLGYQLHVRLLLSPILRDYQDRAPNRVYLGLTIYDVSRREMIYYHEKNVIDTNEDRWLGVAPERTATRNLEQAMDELLRPFVERAAAR